MPSLDTTRVYKTITNLQRAGLVRTGSQDRILFKLNNSLSCSRYAVILRKTKNYFPQFCIPWTSVTIHHCVALLKVVLASSPTSQVSPSAMLVLPIVENWRERFYNSPQRYNVHAKFHPNPSSGSRIESCGEAVGQTGLVLVGSAWLFVGSGRVGSDGLDFVSVVLGWVLVGLFLPGWLDRPGCLGVPDWLGQSVCGLVGRSSVGFVGSACGALKRLFLLYKVYLTLACYLLTKAIIVFQ
jgi:hypothetical protein